MRRVARSPFRGQIAASPTPAARGRLSPHSSCLCLDDEKDPLPWFLSAVLLSLVRGLLSLVRGRGCLVLHLLASRLSSGSPGSIPYVCIPNNGANPYRLTDRCMESNLGYRGHECVFRVYQWVVMLPGARVHVADSESPPLASAFALCVESLLPSQDSEALTPVSAVC